MIYRILHRLLSESADIRDRVGIRIYADAVPEGIDGECIVLSHISSTVHDHLTNESNCANPVMQIDCWSKSPSAAHDLYNRIRNRLSGYSGTTEYLDEDGELSSVFVSACNMISPGVRVEDPSDASDAYKYGYSADFEVFHEQTVPTHL